MDDVVESHGKCLCGSVEVTANTMSTNIGACECDICRKWAGAPFLGVDCKDNVQFTGEEYISVFDSSEWAKRGFCSKCGTHLFYHLKENNQYIVPVGIFDTDEKLKFDHQIFIDSKPDYYTFKNETQNMTGKEVFEMFMNEEN